MFAHYFKSAFRFIRNNGLFAGLNALGLSMALAVSYLILLYVINELSYDHCHKNMKRVYRVLNEYSDFGMTMAGTPFCLSSALKEEYPVVEKAVPVGTPGSFQAKTENGVVDILAYSTDDAIFDVFTIPMIQPLNRQKLLTDKSSIVIARSLADKLFPEKDPVGQDMIVLVNGNEHIFRVTGVYKDLPKNTVFKPGCLVNSEWSLEFIGSIFGMGDVSNNWTIDIWTTWVLLDDKGEPSTLEQQLVAFKDKYLGKGTAKKYLMQNLSDVYLDSEKVANTGISGNRNQINMFLAIGIALLLVATFNYVILATAVSTKRTKEIGIRKVFGAARNTIASQLMGESVVTGLMIFPIAIVLAYLAMPYAESLFHTRLHIIASNLPSYLFIFFGLTLAIGIISGIYTSLYLSRLDVLKIMKNVFITGSKRQIFRSSLIIIQLTIFISFVAGTLIIRSQYKFALKRDPGFYNQDVLLISLGNNFKGYNQFLESVKSIPNVLNVTGAMEGLPMFNSMSSVYPNFQNKEVQVKVEGMAVDYNFIQTAGLRMVSGRDFSKEFGSDFLQAAILNETAVRQLGMKDPIGAKLGDREVIGVVKDFTLHNIHADVPPVMITLTDQFLGQIILHYQSGTLKTLLHLLETAWKKMGTEEQFSYTTVEDAIKLQYDSEKNLTTVVTVSSMFILFVAMVGLFGLTLFISRLRTREFGLRKVFGSSERRLIVSLLSQYYLLVVIGGLISIPVVLFIMQKWLSGFVHRTPISAWVFIVSFMVALLAVTLTVLTHVIRISRTDPVKTLRYE